MDLKGPMTARGQIQIKSGSIALLSTRESL